MKKLIIFLSAIAATVFVSCYNDKDPNLPPEPVDIYSVHQDGGIADSAVEAAKLCPLTTREFRHIEM